jgi:hypothetical protein
MLEVLDCHAFKILGTALSVTRQDIPEVLNLQQHCRDSLKSCMLSASFMHVTPLHYIVC